jgi:predicted nicotinamide N-methyase
MRTAAEHRTFVRNHTVLEAVPFVPEVQVHTATSVTSLWSATNEWLDRVGIDVPFWSVPWAGGQALARWLLDHPDSVRGRRVVDFGTGSGLVAIAAARAGASHVRAIDVDPLACEACALNASANGVALEIACLDPIDLPTDAEIVLAGDVWYERRTAERAAPWLRALAAAGARVLTGDPDRAYAPRDLLTLRTYDVPTSADLEASRSRSTRVAELR